MNELLNTSSANKGACDTVENERVSGGVSSEEDDFLRQRWLECCDHLSAFYIEEETYKVPYGMGPVGPFGDPNERSMKAKPGECLRKGTRFEHIYDFGTFTELKLARGRLT